VVLGLGLLAPIIETGNHVHALFPWLATAVGCLLVVLALVPRTTRLATGALAIATLAFALWTSPHADGLTTRINASDDELALARWVRTNTPVDALFLAPPGAYRFRLLARRAVVADTKSPPLRPDLLIAWYQRLCAMTRYPDAPTFEAVEQRYGEMSAAQLTDVAREFGADYIVVEAATVFADAPVFASNQFRVYRVSAK
jgi:hypothetical protein